MKKKIRNQIREKALTFLEKNYFLFFLLVVGYIYRIWGLKENYSFWTDENHVAIFVRAILERGRAVLTNSYHTDVYQQFLYWLSAISAKIFGLNEFAVRFPSVIFGILTIWAVHLLAKELFAEIGPLRERSAQGGPLAGESLFIPFLAVFLVTFLKIEILWSRQARPYQALQFFHLLGAYFVYKIAKSKKVKMGNFLGFLICGILAFLTHGLGLVILFNGLIFLLVTNFSRLKKWILVCLPVFLTAVFIFRRLIALNFSNLGKVNNLFYYRVFLTHNYLPLVILAGLGGLFLLIKKEYQKVLLFLIFLGVQGFIVSFLLGQPFVRYLYVVFPFIILLAAHGLVTLSVMPNSRFVKKVFFFLLLVLLTLGMKDKFAFLPQKTYSLNEDMQEIPEVDWKKIYKLVKEKLEENSDVVLITNWNDLPVWYLGEGRLDYLVRKDSQELDLFSNAKIVDSLEKLKEIIRSKESGLIILDSWDDRVPDSVREYCHQNLKREFEIDRLYREQPRYWTVWVYSWGLE